METSTLSSLTFKYVWVVLSWGDQLVSVPQHTHSTVYIVVTWSRLHTLVKHVKPREMVGKHGQLVVVVRVLYGVVLLL